MPATGARRGHLVYHWKHGWIPLDHMAALSKAKGSHKGAEKIMQKHGISGGHDSHRTHPVGVTVAARQPGIERETHGKVVGHDSNGMLKVQYQDRKGNPVVGTFNPSHTQVTAVVGKPQPHPAPHTLKPGEHATVRGIDHMGQPATFTGKVTSNGEVSSFAKGRTTGGQPLRSIGIERQDGSRRSNVVYVPDPNRGEQKRQTNSQALAAARAESDHITLYHGTHARHVEGIKKDGLKQAMNGTAQSYTLTTSKKQAEGYAAGHGKDAAVVEFHVPKSEVRKIGVNNDAALWNTTTQHNVYGETGTAYALRRTLPAKYVAKVHGSSTPSPASRPVGIMGRPSALDSMPSIAPRNSQMRGEHVVTAKEAAANRAAMKDMSKRAEDTLKAAQKDSTGKQLLDVAKQGQGTSARSAIVRAAEDVGQGNHEQARKRLETALADTRAMGPAYPGDKTHTADTRALNNALKVLAPEGQSAPQTEAHAKVRDLPAEGEFKGVHSETYKGNKIGVRKGREWGTLQTTINGQVVSPGAHGRTNGHAVRELDSLKGWIDQAHAKPENFGLHTDHPTWGIKPEKAKSAPKFDPHAARAAQLREAAAKKRAEAERIANSVGAPDRAGAMLRAKDSARMNARMDSGLRKYTEAQRQAKALESKAHLADGRSKSAAEKQAAADLAVTPSKLSPGDLIQHKGSAHMVTKVNKTTVSVPSIVGGSWEDKVPIAGISKHVPISQLKDSNLRAMYDKAASHPKLRAAYAAEMKRRGMV